MFLGTETVTVNGAITTNDTNPCESFMVCDEAEAVFTPGSSLTDAGALIVGNDDLGTLIANGSGSNRATLTSQNGKIGRLDSGVGHVTLNDAVWNMTTFLHVGELGAGTLTVTNGSVVTAATGVQVGIHAGATGLLALTDGATLNDGGVLELGALPHDMGGEGSATVTVDATSQMKLSGNMLINAGNTLSLSGGTLTVGLASPDCQVNTGGMLCGYGTVSALGCGITDDGTITASGGTLILDGSVMGNGILAIGAGSTAEINAASMKGIGIEFTGQGGTLALETGMHDTALVSDFAAGDSIVMAGVNQMSWNGTTDVLTLKETGTTVSQVHFVGSYQGNPFSLTQSSAGAVITIGNGH
jgi:T5SS/PEP-CTERM-associated repeat protein